MRKIAFFAAGSVCLIAGCTGTGAEYEPVVDGSRGAQYQSDLAACQSLSETKSLMNPETKTQATLGAVVMGAAAGLDDDAGGDRLGSALGGALLGGLLGTAGGATEAHFERQDIIKDCLKSRGHRVVG